MPDIHSYWRTDRPAEGFYTSELPADSAVQTVRTFLPEGYEPRYPYPLLVLFHGRRDNEEQILRLVPRLSRRNYIAISLRGPEQVGTMSDGVPAYGWSDEPDAIEQTTDYMLRAVEQTRRNYHIHTERVFLIGMHEGAAVAYRTAFALGDKIAGVAALNGSVPRPVDGRPLFRMDAVRNLRVLIAHGRSNQVVPLSSAERDQRIFYAAGADVQLQTYPTTNRLHADMLKDLNKWVIGHVNEGCDVFARNR